MSDEPGTPDASSDFVANMDQLASMVKEVARVVHSYYAALCEQGFNPDQALALAIAYQAITMSNRG